MVSAAIRIAHYNNRMSSSLLDPVFTAVADMAKAHYLVHAIDITQRQIDTVAILDTDGILGAFRFLYLAYSNQLYHLCKVYSGTPLVSEATTLCTKYTAQFLAAATLKKIAHDVYAITIP